MAKFKFSKESKSFKNSSEEEKKSGKEIIGSFVVAFNEVGMEQKDQETVWSVVSAVLSLANTTIDDSIVDRVFTESPCLVQNTRMVNANEFLGFNEESLEEAIAWSHRQVANYTIESVRTKTECRVAIDSMMGDCSHGEPEIE